MGKHVASNTARHSTSFAVSEILHSSHSSSSLFPTEVNAIIQQDVLIHPMFQDPLPHDGFVQLSSLKEQIQPRFKHHFVKISCIENF